MRPWRRGTDHLIFDVIQPLTTLQEAKTSPKLARKSEDVPEPLFSLRFANRKESVNSGLAEREGPAGGVCSQFGVELRFHPWIEEKLYSVLKKLD